MKLLIIDDIVDTVGRVHRHSRKVARQDPSLAKQMREAASSVGLNAGEGLYARGGNRTCRLDSAMNSGREVIVALHLAGAAGYLATAIVAHEVDQLDRIVATLYKLAFHGR